MSTIDENEVYYSEKEKTLLDVIRLQDIEIQKFIQLFFDKERKIEELYDYQNELEKKIRGLDETIRTNRESIKELMTQAGL